MKIWIDLTNSPHVNFFARMIEDLDDSHELVITCRPLANTIEMLESAKIRHVVVGKHYGRNNLLKAWGFLVRNIQLYRFLKNRRPDVAISHSSFYSPVVARMLGIPSIYLNDNEHAGGNRISFRFATTVMVPEFLDLAKVEKQGARPDSIVPYPGVKEGVYLWDLGDADEGAPFPIATADAPLIVVRPEPWTAQYYKGERNVLDDVLLDLMEDYPVLLLPRGADQRKHYSRATFANVTIPDKPVTLAQLKTHCSLFIGAGGTMTREAAVLGIPTISIYQDELLDVDRYLIDQGLMTHEPRVTAASVRQRLATAAARPPDERLLAKGRKAHDKILNTLLSATAAGEVASSC